MHGTAVRCGYALALVGWSGVLWLTLRTSGTEPPAPGTGLRTMPPAEKHYVTPRQLAEAGARAGQPTAPLVALNEEGLQPVVIVFIKKDCPCSVEFEPYFHRLEQCYRGQARFIGVIDGSPADACRYAAANKVPYPVVADVQNAIIRHFKAENGGYVALLRPDGTVATMWPGCSVAMLRELSRQIAFLAGVDGRMVDGTGLPVVLTTGCPFAS